MLSWNSRELRRSGFERIAIKYLFLLMKINLSRASGGGEGGWKTEIIQHAHKPAYS